MTQRLIRYATDGGGVSQTLKTEETDKRIEVPSIYSKKCPNVALVVVRGNGVKVIDTMGPHFENCPEDIVLVEEHADVAGNGVYVVELRFVRGDGWETDDDVEFDGRPLTDDEWERWKEWDDPWPPDWWAPNEGSKPEDTK